MFYIREALFGLMVTEGYESVTETVRKHRGRETGYGMVAAGGNSNWSSKLRTHIPDQTAEKKVPGVVRGLEAPKRSPTDTLPPESSYLVNLPNRAVN